MRLWFAYLRSKRKPIGIIILFFALILVSTWLYRLPLAAVCYPVLLCTGIGSIVLLLDFLQMKRLHEDLERMKGWDASSFDEMPSQGNILEEDYIEILKNLCEQKLQSEQKANTQYRDMVDYYTIWVHQIKTPIAAMRLNIQAEDSAFARVIRQDLNRIERYVEMVLTFLRLNAESTDYVIKSYDLDEMIRSVVKGFSSEFIGKHLRLNYQPVGQTVVTDEKWLSFVLEQLLSNAVKYTPDGGEISIYMDGGRLCVKDTGIGIAAEDLPRIFEKGYTGFNGRMDKKASGIGLYLCKEICRKLEHPLDVTSAVGEGTTFYITVASDFVTRM